MPQVLEAFPTDLLILPDLSACEDSSAGLERTLETADACGVPQCTAQDGQVFPLGQGSLTVLQAGEIPEEEGDSIDTNNLSLCLRYTAGDFSFVDTGDAEQAVEEQLVARYGSRLDSDLLKAGHHGSDTSNTQVFLDAVSPGLLWPAAAWTMSTDIPTPRWWTGWPAAGLPFTARIWTAPSPWSVTQTGCRCTAPPRTAKRLPPAA